jgi:hypothetical protein
LYININEIQISSFLKIWCLSPGAVGSIRRPIPQEANYSKSNEAKQRSHGIQILSLQVSFRKNWAWVAWAKCKGIAADIFCGHGHSCLVATKSLKKVSKNSRKCHISHISHKSHMYKMSFKGWLLESANKRMIYWTVLTCPFTSCLLHTCMHNLFWSTPDMKLCWINLK